MKNKADGGFIIVVVLFTMAAYGIAFVPSHAPKPVTPTTTTTTYVRRP